MNHTPEIPLDLQMLLGNRVEELARYFVDAIRPPSTEAYDRWAEQHIELPASGADIPGRINFDLFPAVRFFFARDQHPKNRRSTCLKCSQSTATTMFMIILAHDVSEDPGPTMWVMAVADQVKEFGKDRLFPFFEQCKTAFAHAPKDRRHWTSNYIKFDTMSLFLRGSNSKAKLKSSPVKNIYCDERDEWKPGAINTLRKRLTTFSDSKERSAGVGGNKNDELHTDWKSGSQTFVHFRCAKCGHSQPWRFGKKRSVLFDTERSCGGVVFDNYEITKPNGVWDLDSVEREAKWECENPECRHRHEKSEKSGMIKSCHEVHRNPRALPLHYSVSWQLAFLPWAEADWGKIARRFLEALAALKHGDIEKYKTFVQEDEGEPFEPPALHKQAGDLTNRIGNYKTGETWNDPKDPTKLEPNTVLVLTFDRQMMQKQRYVIRQWRATGQSRLIEEGWRASLDDLRASQIEKRVKDKCTWGDDRGPGVSEFRLKAMTYGWNILAGDDFPYFTINQPKGAGGEKKSIRQGWRQTNFDPGIGTTRQGRAAKIAYQWSNKWYKDKLYFYFLRGLMSPLWEIPTDISGEYLAEMNANEYREKENSDGSTEGFFFETGPDHAADCELEQLAVADIAGFTRYLQPPTK